MSSAAQMDRYSCVSHSMTHLVLGSGRPRHWTSERASSATINRRRHQTQLVRQEACERTTARQPGNPHTKCPDQPIAHDITHNHIAHIRPSILRDARASGNANESECLTFLWEEGRLTYPGISAAYPISHAGTQQNQVPTTQLRCWGV